MQAIETSKLVRVPHLWDVLPHGTYLSKAGMAATAHIPGPKTVHETTMKGDDGNEVTVALFIENVGAGKHFSDVVVLIPANAPKWTEEAAEQHFAKFLN